MQSDLLPTSFLFFAPPSSFIPLFPMPDSFILFAPILRPNNYAPQFTFEIHVSRNVPQPTRILTPATKDILYELWRVDQGL